MKIYIGLLAIFSVISLTSYFTSKNQYFDSDQAQIHQEAKERELTKWGAYWVSPLSLGLPAFIIVIIYCIAHADWTVLALL